LNRVLLIEDDKRMQELIENYLQNYNFEVISFDNPKDAIDALSKEEFDIVVLDLMLPHMDGFDVCKIIKERSNIPIIISTARADLGNKIMGFELGVDDYLSKPYEPRELVLRLEAVLRRVRKDISREFGDFFIDEVNRVVRVEGFDIDFTKVEFEIFLYLIKNRGKVVSREQILYNTSLSKDTKNRTVDMHISNIRYKIGDDPKRPKYIKSVWGIGYKFI